MLFFLHRRSPIGVPGLHHPSDVAAGAISRAQHSGRPFIPFGQWVPRAHFSVACAPLRGPHRLPIHMQPPRLFSFSSRHGGHRIFGALFSPTDASHHGHQDDDGVKDSDSETRRKANFGNGRPLVLFVYGGPRVQLVSDDNRLTKNAQIQILCHLGFYVACIDAVGSWRRGLQFEGVIRQAMGTSEMRDQVDGVRLLLARCPGVIDPSRVAIMGSSYGGYASLLGT